MLSYAIRFHLLLAVILAVVCVIQAQSTESATPLTAEQTVKDGLSAFQEKQYDRAVDLFKQAIKLKPDSAAAYDDLGAVYISMGRQPDALEPLKTAIRLEPGRITAYLNLGITYAALRRADEALEVLNTAKQLNPNDYRVYMQIGNVLHNNFGRIEEALASYQEARRVGPSFPPIYNNIGLMYMRLGRFAEAIGPLEEALKLDPQFRDSRYFLSDAYSKVGRYEDAAESYSKYLLITPNGPEALTKRSWNYLYAGGHGRDAAAGAQTFIKTQGWKNSIAPYLAVMANIGYREAGMNEEAQAVIGEASKKITPNTWTYNLVRYFNGEISSDELMQLAVDNNKKTEAHTYLGMDSLLKGKNEEASAHFSWVKEYGNKQFFEYPLAIAELKRLAK